MIPHCRSVELLEHKLSYVREGAERAGRDEFPRIVMRMDTSVMADSEEAKFAAKRRLGRMLWQQYPNVRYLETLGLKMPSLASEFEAAGPFVYTFDLTVFERFVDVIPDTLLEPIALAGTPDEVARQTEDLAAAGADEICIHPVPAEGQTSDDVILRYAQGLAISG